MLLFLVAGLASVAWSFFRGGERNVEVPALKIEVLNGCGETGLAQAAAERLQGLGHDVVLVGDAPSTDISRTVMLDRRGRDRLSRELARRIGPCPVVLERVESAEVDLTLILGADWRQLLLFSSGRAFSEL
jgi:hypothetical protein